MTAMKSLLLSAAATIADCVVRSSAVAAVTRKFLASSWVTQVSAPLGIGHQSGSDSKLNGLARTSCREFSTYSGPIN